MTVDEIRLAVERHACHVHGIRYGFLLKWAAVEPYVDPARARCLLNVEFVASPGGRTGSGSQMLVRIARLSELAPLLDDVLHHHLAEQLIVEGTDVSSSPKEIGKATFPSAAIRSN